MLGLEVHADPRVKEDPSYSGRYGGGTVYGRTSTPGATRVAMYVPGFSAPITAAVDARTGYFVAAVPDSIGTALLDDSSGAAHRTGDWRVVVRDESGDAAARTR